MQLLKLDLAVSVLVYFRNVVSYLANCLFSNFKKIGRPLFLCHVTEHTLEFLDILSCHVRHK